MLAHRLRRYIRNGTLTQLAAFQTVVELGSFTRAADALHMAQPTVSLLVKKLGETLGVQLLKTTTHGIQLTTAGAEAYKFCQEFFESCAGFDDRLAEYRLASAGVLRLAVCTGAESTVPGLLRHFYRQYPQTRLCLSIANRAQLRERLAAGTDDFYVFGVPPDDPGVRRHPLFTDEFHIYASADHRHAHRKILSFADVADEPFVMREVGARARIVADELFAEHGRRPNIRMEIDNTEALICAVASGLGIALLSQRAVESNPCHAELVPLHVDGLPVRHQWQLVYRPNKKLSGCEQSLVDELCAGTVEQPARPALMTRRKAGERTRARRVVLSHSQTRASTPMLRS